MAEFKTIMGILKRKYESMGMYNFDYDKMEKEALEWAAEHPVYPTWLEYLCEIGVIPKVIDCKTLFLDVYNGVHDHRIPADIAEKLGLQPKEG